MRFEASWKMMSLIIKVHFNLLHAKLIFSIIKPTVRFTLYVTAEDQKTLVMSV